MTLFLDSVNVRKLFFQKYLRAAEGTPTAYHGRLSVVNIN